jgi:hypothetical protein
LTAVRSDTQSAGPDFFVDIRHLFRYNEKRTKWKDNATIDTGETLQSRTKKIDRKGDKV